MKISKQEAIAKYKERKKQEEIAARYKEQAMNVREGEFFQEDMKQRAKDFAVFHSFMESASWYNKDGLLEAISDISDYKTLSRAFSHFLKEHAEIMDRHENEIVTMYRSMAKWISISAAKERKAELEAKAKLKEANEFLKEIGFDDLDVKSEWEVMSEQLGENCTYSQWEEEVAKFYADIKEEREEAGESVSSYWNNKSSNISSDSDKSDLVGPSFISSAVPVDETGIMETCAALFSRGIQTGVSFDLAFRNSYFEEGMQVNHVRHDDIDEICTFDMAERIRNKNAAYTRNLVTAMQRATARNEDRLKESKLWIDTTKEEITTLVNNAKSFSEAEKAVNVTEILSNVVSTASNGKFRMPYLAVKIVNFEKPVTMLEAIEAIEAKDTTNAELIKELTNFKNDLINSKFNVFSKVKDYVAFLLDIMDVYEAKKTLLSNESLVTKAEMQEAMYISASWKNSNRFTKEEFALLVRCGIKTGTPKKKKPTYVITPELAELIRALKAGDFDVVTEENAQQICEVAAKAGPEYRLPVETYYFVKSMIA